MASNNSKRLQRDLMDIQKSEDLNFFKIEADENNIQHWTGLLVPESSAYNKGAWKVDIVFPNDFPFKPPKVSFQTKIYHPNIDEEGQICLPILLSENWKPLTKIEEIIRALVKLIDNPETDHPLRADLAEEYIKERDKFVKNAQEFTKKYAEPVPEEVLKKIISATEEIEVIPVAHGLKWKAGPEFDEDIKLLDDEKNMEDWLKNDEVDEDNSSKENKHKRKLDSLQDLEERNSNKAGKYDTPENTIVNSTKSVVEPEKHEYGVGPRPFAGPMDYKKNAPIGVSFSGLGSSLHVASPLNNGNTVPYGSQNSSLPLANNINTASRGVQISGFAPFTSPVANRYPEFNQDKLNYVAALNMQVAEWIMKNVKENPLVILTPVFKEYEKHLQSIMESPPTNRS